MFDLLWSPNTLRLRRALLKKNRFNDCTYCNSQGSILICFRSFCFLLALFSCSQHATTGRFTWRKTKITRRTEGKLHLKLSKSSTMNMIETFSDHIKTLYNLMSTAHFVWKTIYQWCSTNDKLLNGTVLIYVLLQQRSIIKWNLSFNSEVRHYWTFA